MVPSEAIRLAYYDALFGSVTSNGLPVPFFDVYVVPENVNKPYVLLSTQTANQLTIKRCKRYNATMLIDIVTGGQNNMAGRRQAEDIASQIESIINPDTFEDLDLTAYGYQLGNTETESDTDSSLKSGSEYIYRKLIRYNHLIVKL